MLELVKKQAVDGSPIPFTAGLLYLSIKWGGISSGIGIAAFGGVTLVSRSGRRFLMVAMRLNKKKEWGT